MPSSATKRSKEINYEIEKKISENKLFQFWVWNEKFALKILRVWIILLIIVYESEESSKILQR